MAEYADTTAIEAVWRLLSTTEASTADALLRYASAMLRMKVPALDARLADGTLDPVLVEGVTVAMVVRAMRNPDGVRQLSVDEHSVTFDPKASAPSQLTVEADELALLAPVFEPASTVGTIGLGSRFYPRFVR